PPTALPCDIQLPKIHQAMLLVACPPYLIIRVIPLQKKEKPGKPRAVRRRARSGGLRAFRLREPGMTWGRRDGTLGDTCEVVRETDQRPRRRLTPGGPRRTLERCP